MSNLAQKICGPCNKLTPRLNEDQIVDLLTKLHGWSLTNLDELNKRFSFKNFKSAWEFVNKVSEIAEAENHHPDICFGWDYAEFTIKTHAIKGLSENDFILAAKIDVITH